MKKILIVDDDVDLAEMARMVLSGKGYSVFLAHDSDECIKEAKSRKPDLILMDIMLPDRDGAETIKILKEDEEMKNINVLFASSLLSDNEEINREGLVIDGVKYEALAKPYETAELLDKIKKNLN